MKSELVLFLAASFAALSVRAEPLDASVFRKSVAISVGSGKHSGAALSDFPVLVRLDRASGFSLADFSDPAAELRFADASGESLDFEIDTWDSSLGAIVWVSVPSLDSATALTACFAPQTGASLPAVSPSAVWTKAGYVGVWHMNAQNADGSYPDSTGLGATLEPNGAGKPAAPATEGAGALGSAWYEVPEDKNAILGVSAANASGWNFASVGYTAEAWVGNLTGEFHRIFCHASGTGNAKNSLALGPGRIYQMSGSWNVKNWPAGNPGTAWRHVVSVLAPADGSFGSQVYENGVGFFAGSQKAVDFDDAGMLVVARSDSRWKHRMDEIRVRAGNSTADWTAANYATQADPAFFDYGSVVSADAAVSGGDAAAADVAWTTVTLSAEFAVADSVSGGVAVTLSIAPDGGAAFTVPAGTISAASGAVSAAVDDLLPGTAYTAWFSATFDGETAYSGTASFTTAALPESPTVSGVGDTTATVSAAFTLEGVGYAGVSAVFSDGSSVPATFANGAWTAVATSLGKDSDYTVRFAVLRADGTEIRTSAASFTTTGTVAVDPAAFRASLTMTATGYDGASTLAFFPVLVRIPASVASTVADAADLRFADAGGTLLAHEIDTWDPSGESLVWVSLRSLAGTATSFTMYWNPAAGAPVPPAHDPASVWTRAGYVAVFHMADATWTDSSGVSGSPVPGNVNAPAVYSVPGPLGASYKGKQTDSSLLLPGSATAEWDVSGGITLETWVNASEAESNWRRVFSAGSSWTAGCETFGAYAPAGGGNNGYYVGRGDTLSSNYKWPASVQSGGWGHMSFVYDGLAKGSAARAYADGVLAASVTVASDISYAASGMGLVSRADAAEAFLGALDEMRVRAMPSTADWAQAVWDTSAPGSTFLSYGDVAENDDFGTIILMW